MDKRTRNTLIERIKDEAKPWEVDLYTHAALEKAILRALDAGCLEGIKEVVQPDVSTAVAFFREWIPTFNVPYRTYSTPSFAVAMQEALESLLAIPAPPDDSTLLRRLKGFRKRFADRYGDDHGWHVLDNGSGVSFDEDHATFLAEFDALLDPVPLPMSLEEMRKKCSPGRSVENVAKALCWKIYPEYEKGKKPIRDGEGAQQLAAFWFPNDDSIGEKKVVAASVESVRRNKETDRPDDE